MWGEEFINFLDALAVLSWIILNNRMNCTRKIWKKGWIHPIIKNRSRQNSESGKEFNTFFFPNRCDDLWLYFCVNPSSTVWFLCNALVKGAGLEKPSISCHLCVIPADAAASVGCPRASGSQHNQVIWLFQDDNNNKIKKLP